MGAEEALKKAIQESMKQQAAKQPVEDGDDDASINDQKKWNAIQKKWAAEKIENAQAHLMAFFDADEDLPLAKHLLLVAIASFFFMFVLWANMAQLDEVTRGQGKIIPSSEVQSLQTIDPGTIEAILVKEGEEVKAGQVLMRLSNIEASSDLEANRARYLGLLASIARLQAEAEGAMTIDFPEEVTEGSPSSVTEELNTFRAKKNQMQGQMGILQQQLSQREQEVRELSTRINDLRGVIRMQNEEVDMVRPLVDRGSAPKMELLQLERAIKERNSELNGYLAGLPRAKAAAEEVRARIDDLENSMKADAQTELSAKQIEMNEIKERLSGLSVRKSRKELKAPVNGIIQEITVNTIGGVARPGEDLIKIVPKDDQLIVEAKISPRDRAFIHPGQKAVIKLTAYDFSIYGGLKGELTYISQDTFEDEKGNTYYTVRLRTDETYLMHNGEKKPITVGMVTSVDILTGKKTVMQYLLKPLIKTLDNAMNER